jgi:NRPS condensation-like uncharacterized protein
VATWNDEHDRPTGTVRVTMPVNGRPPGQRTEILGNLCRLATVATTPADRADPRRLLGAVAAQTNAAKSGGGSPAGAMARVLGNPGLPVGVKSVLTAGATRLARRFVDTVIVSNLGRVVDAPHFDDAGPVTAVRFSLPARMPRGLSIGAVTHADRLSLCFRYRYALLDRAGAGRFVAICTAALAELSDEALGGCGRSR